MTIINPKSISGITSITTASGADNLFTVHTNNTTERFRIDSTGTASFGGDVSIGGTVSVGGTITYEDVTNVDSVGLITARNGIEIGARPGVAASISVDGNMIISGISTFGGAANFAAISGTTGTFSGAVSGTTGTFSGAVSGTTGTFSGAVSGTTGTFTGDVDIADKIVHTGDTNTAIRFPSADTVRIDTAGSNRFKIDSNGRIGILDPNLDNFDSSADDLVINGAANTGITINSGGTSSTSEGALVFAEGNGSGGSADGFRGAIQYKHGDDRMMFYTNNGEGMRITGDNRVYINTTSPVDGNSILALKQGFGSSGCGMEIVHNGNPLSGRDFIRFYNQSNAEAGSIEHNASTSVAYLTSSDYRLKENVVNITDGIERLKLLKPRKFNWIADSELGSRDGFLAHEVSPIIPHCVSGEKDAVKEDGSIQTQTMDYGQVTPLLTAALQEAVTKIEVLETRLNNAGIAT